MHYNPESIWLTTWPPVHEDQSLQPCATVYGMSSEFLKTSGCSRKSTFMPSEMCHATLQSDVSNPKH